MRHRKHFLLLALAGIALGGSAAVATEAPPAAAAPSHVVFGTIMPAAGEAGKKHDFCAVPAGATPFSGSPSAFQRDGNGDAFVQFSSFDYFAEGLDYNFGGWVQLHFTDNKSGKVLLDAPPYATDRRTGKISNKEGFGPKFSGYLQSYDADAGTVSIEFNLDFPPQNGGGPCTLPVIANYRDLNRTSP